jgi:ubiquitin-protein ligase
MAFLNRLARECEQLLFDPPFGFHCWRPEECNNKNGDEVLLARLEGPCESPYADGQFILRLQINQRYPIEPPGKNQSSLLNAF